MSRLVELIQQYCSNGVDYVKLGDFATQWYRGAGIKKDEVSQEGIPCIRYGEIHTTYKIWFDKCVSHTDETKQPSRKYADYGDILFAITSEDIPFIGNSVAYVGKERILVGGDIVVMKHDQNPKYISYALSTTDAVQQKGKGKVKSKVVHTNVPSLKEIIIPLPPLPVQEEIVRILDLVSGMHLSLHAELQAELQNRLQQYNFYREDILSFKGRADVEWKKLGDVADLLSGFPFDSSQFTGRGIKLMRGINIKRGQLCFNDTDDRYWESEKGLEKYIVKENDIVISMDGSLVGRSFGMIKKEYLPLLLVQRVARVRVSSANINYIYHCICNWFPDYVDKKKTSGAIPHISMRDIAEFIIPIPSLNEQQKIVDILDRFDSLNTDLTAVLQAEIEKRRQQYECYRDRLLTFKRK